MRAADRQGTWVESLACFETRVAGAVCLPLFDDEPKPCPPAPRAEEQRVTASTNNGNDQMIINDTNLRTIYTAFNAAFKDSYGSAPTFWRKVAMDVSSSTSEEEYGWLGLFPQLREWLGDRIIQSLAVQSYRIKNRSYELTVSVPRDRVEDDRVGIYSPMFKQMGRGAAELSDKLIGTLLASGVSTVCYDGQYFFDIDHPVLDVNGTPVSVANYSYVAPPAGQPDYPTWYLLDTSREVRPFIYQERRPYVLVAKDKPTDDNVFHCNEFLYGVDGRSNAGFGLWQLAYAVTGPLNAATYAATRLAITGLRGDFGHPIGVVPNVLVAPMALEPQARALLKADRDPYGASNIWMDSADLILTPWL